MVNQKNIQIWKILLAHELHQQKLILKGISRLRKHIPAPIPEEYSIHFPVSTSSVVPNRLRELRILHNLRTARKAAYSNLGSPVKRDNAPISRIKEPRARNKIY